MKFIDGVKALTEVEADKFAKDDAAIVLMYNLALMPSIRFEGYVNYDLYCAKFYQYIKEML